MKIKVSVLADNPSLSVSDEGKTKIMVALRDMLKKQAKDGVQVTSAGRYPVMPKGRDGKRIDLVDTGAMWGEVRFAPLEMNFTVPYARYVIPKYAAGLSPRYHELWAAKCVAIVKKHLVIKKGES